MEPPDPISNSEVKRFSADGSVGSPHVRVGHCQDLTPKIPGLAIVRVFFCLMNVQKPCATQHGHVKKMPGAFFNVMDAFSIMASKR